MTDNGRSIKDQIQGLSFVADLKQKTKALRMANLFVRSTEVEKQVKAIEDELTRITGIVERFYKTLGERHWVFSDALNLDRIDEILNEGSPEKSETALIDYLKEPGTLSGPINRLNRFPDMRPRLDLLRKAEADYRQGRYYSAVLVVVSVMDGFVNDFNKSERRGLHARAPHEMESNDGAATIFAGLPSVQEVFTKSVCKRNDEPLFEVERHALMHGMATNYDNEVIASKAWCMLFAIADWAKSSEGPRAENKTVDLIEATSQYLEQKKRNKRDRESLNQWKAHEVDLNNPSQFDAAVINAIVDYCTAWKNRNYGRLSRFFPNFTNKSEGSMAGEARMFYAPHPITNYKILEIARPAAAIAEAGIRLESAERCWSARIRLARQDDDGHPAAEWEPGNWKVVMYGTSPFIDVDD